MICRIFNGPLKIWTLMFTVRFSSMVLVSFEYFPSFHSTALSMILESTIPRVFLAGSRTHDGVSLMSCGSFVSLLGRGRFCMFMCCFSFSNDEQVLNTWVFNVGLPIDPHGGLEPPYTIWSRVGSHTDGTATPQPIVLSTGRHLGSRSTHAWLHCCAGLRFRGSLPSSLVLMIANYEVYHFPDSLLLKTCGVNEYARRPASNRLAALIIFAQIALTSIADQPMAPLGATLKTGRNVRLAARANLWPTPTSGPAPGYLQANLLVLPSRSAADFRLLCQRNPVPCPLIIESLKPGNFSSFKL